MQRAPRHTKSSKTTAAFSLSASIHAAEHGFYREQESAIHNFQVNRNRNMSSRYFSSLVLNKTTLEPASYTDEKSALFAKYQQTIHHDYDSSPSGFRRFLVSSPLQVCLACLFLFMLIILQVAPIPYE